MSFSLKLLKRTLAALASAIPIFKTSAQEGFKVHVYGTPSNGYTAVPESISVEVAQADVQRAIDSYRMFAKSEPHLPYSDIALQMEKKIKTGRYANEFTRNIVLLNGYRNAFEQFIQQEGSNFDFSYIGAEPVWIDIEAHIGPENKDGGNGY